MVPVVLRFLFGKTAAVGIPLGLLWVMWKDPGGVRTAGLDWFANHLVENIKDALLPAGN